jgi:dTDP-4-amino-4,6-dideoxygalactose transaminase
LSILRQQLPARSPLSAAATLAATAQVVGVGADPRRDLRVLLQREYAAHGVALYASGTVALTIAINEARRRTGSKGPIALPAFSCFDIATAAAGANARISFYDLNPATLAPDEQSLARVFRAGAHVAVVAPLYGIPVPWDSLTKLAAEHGAVLIEDAAQGRGAGFRGAQLGSLGATAVLSFGRGKGWTGGAGGALLVNGPDIPTPEETTPPDFLEELATSASLAAQWALGRPALYRIPFSIPALGLGETVYRNPRRPRSISRAAAAALLATHDAARQESEARKRNAMQLLGVIAENSAILPIAVPSEGCAGYLRLPVRIRGGLAAFGTQSQALGIAASYPGPLPVVPPIAALRDGPETSWPGAETLVRELVTLPTHSYLGSEDLAELARTLRALPPP